MRTLLIAIVSLALYTAHSAKANDWGVFLQGPGGGAYYSHGRPPPSPRYYYRGPPVVVVPQPYGYGAPAYGYGGPMYGVPYGYGGGYGGYSMHRGPDIRCRHYLDSWGNEIGQECWYE